jgi:hypothetical protein
VPPAVHACHSVSCRSVARRSRAKRLVNASPLSSTIGGSSFTLFEGQSSTFQLHSYFFSAFGIKFARHFVMQCKKIFEDQKKTF